MGTITTKQLREDMPKVVRQLRAGQPVTLTYRKKIIGTIQPATPPEAPRRGSPEAIRQGLVALRKLSVPASIRKDPRSIKEQIAELRDNDPRYRGY